MTRTRGCLQQGPAAARARVPARVPARAVPVPASVPVPVPVLAPARVLAQAPTWVQALAVEVPVPVLAGARALRQRILPPRQGPVRFPQPPPERPAVSAVPRRRRGHLHLPAGHFRSGTSSPRLLRPAGSGSAGQPTSLTAATPARSRLRWAESWSKRQRKGQSPGPGQLAIRSSRTLPARSGRRPAAHPHQSGRARYPRRPAPKVAAPRRRLTMPLPARGQRTPSAAQAQSAGPAQSAGATQPSPGREVGEALPRW